MRAEARVSRTVLRALLRQRLRTSARPCCATPGSAAASGSRTPSTGIFGDTGSRRGEFFDVGQHNMLMADPPDHTRLRRLVSRSFTPRQVERLRPAIHDWSTTSSTTWPARGEVEFMTEFALPLPMAVIGELVGVPAEDRAGLQPKVRAAARGIEPVLTEEEIDAVDRRHRRAGRVLRGASWPSAGASHATTCMSALARRSENDDRLTDDEILSTAILLFSAGFETTTNLLGNGLLALLATPTSWPTGGRHPEIAPTAVEELLRFDSPVQFNLRTALEPAELAGEPLERGDRIVVLQGAANRDPEAVRPPRRARPPPRPPTRR